MPVLMWMNDYCGFETLLEECKKNMKTTGMNY